VLHRAILKHDIQTRNADDLHFELQHERTALEADGIGWAMWDYRGGFGVVTKQDGQPAQVDESVVKALGLSGR
jgi:hypothetical protein